MKHLVHLDGLSPAHAAHAERHLDVIERGADVRLRVPIVETDEDTGALVLTWNRHGVYLDLTVEVDGRVQWFCAVGEERSGTRAGAVDDLPEEALLLFRSLAKEDGVQ